MSLGNSSFGFSGGGGGGGVTPIIGGGTLNYLAKFTPDGTTIGNSLLFDNGTNVGVGTVLPTAKFHVEGGNGVTSLFQSNASSVTGYAGRFFANSVNTQSNVGIYVTASNGFQNYAIHADEGNSGFGGLDANSKIYVKGIDATSSNYAFKADNSAASPLLYVRNDGSVGIGITPSLSDTKLEINVSLNNRVLFRNFPIPSLGGDTFIFQNVNQFNNAVSNIVFLGYNSFHASEKNLFSNFSNIIPPTAKVHIIGENVLNTTFAIKIQNLILSELFCVTDFGNVGISTTAPTSKLQVVGLPTYADNAAAITGGLTVGAFYIRTGHGLDVVV